MQPLTLTLKGFRGIRDGLGLDTLTLDFERMADGAQLVAIAGANGRGKSTVIENCHPYLTMPSRAAVAGPGGFSYFDHVFLPESEKDLTWSLEGRCYRSRVVIRIGSRRRTEAYLHVLDESGRWQPVRLVDGTISDGKVDTYTRCVEALCGSADTFFTSAFSAQGRRQLSSYRNAEIKALLADLLGQAEIRTLGQKASETARLLKAGLSAIRQEVASLEEERRRIVSEQGRIGDATTRVARTAGQRQSARQALEAAQTLHARLGAEEAQSRGIETRRMQLQAERKSIAAEAASTLAALKAQDAGEVQRLARLDQRIRARGAERCQRLQTLQGARQQFRKTLVAATSVRRAIVRRPLAEYLAELRAQRTGECRAQVQSLMQTEAACVAAEQALASVEREAGKAALTSTDLSHRFGLTSEVPCSGTGLQDRCKLLGDALAAKALLPNASAQIARLALERKERVQAVADLKQQRQELAGAPALLARAERLERGAWERASLYAVLSGRANEIEQARDALAKIEEELAAMNCSAPDQIERQLPDELAERQQIGASRRTITQQQAALARRIEGAQARVDQALAALPVAFDRSRLHESAQTLSIRRDALAAAEDAHLAATRDAQALEALSWQLRALVVRQARVGARAARTENELGDWTLFARCMSNDGLISLAIDDAGPALSGLTNDLLLACYGPRFTVSIQTLLENGRGEQREGFDIVVHDADMGESKSVTLLSGGERLWIDQALTRAVALYLAHQTGRHYAALFSDEADGAFDPQRKRMYMAMKREVLRLGGYEREYFISQTPELTAMADVVIDLDGLLSERMA